MRKKLWLKIFFSDILKTYISAHGLTRKGLADRAGICVKNLNKLLNGNCDVKSETIQKLMQAIGLNDKLILVFLMNHVDETVKRKRCGGLIYNLLILEP